MDAKKMGRKNADPLVGLPLIQRNYDAGEGKDIDRTALRFVKRTSTGHHYSMYVKGFILDTVTQVEVPSQGGGIPDEWCKLAGWTDPTAPDSDVPEEFWRTLVADRGKDERNPPMYYAKACKESIVKGGIQSGTVDTSNLINNERNSIVAQFCRRVQSVIWNRRLMKTQRELLGLGNKRVQPGDIVCILYGCSVPVILRQTEKTDDEMEKEKKEDEKKSGEALAKLWKRRLDARANRKRKWSELTEEKKEEAREVLGKWKEEQKLEIEVEMAHKEWLKKKRALPARKVDGGWRKYHYEFIGECYLHGMMDGEAIEVLNNEKITEVVFEIR